MQHKKTSLMKAIVKYDVIYVSMPCLSECFWTDDKAEIVLTQTLTYFRYSTYERTHCAGSIEFLIACYSINAG